MQHAVGTFVNPAAALASAASSGQRKRTAVMTLVGFLTAECRKSDASRRLRGMAAAILLIAATMADVTAAGEWHPVEALGDIAEEFLSGHIGRTDSRISLRANPLDSRLQLPRCSKKPEGFLQRGATMNSRMTVGVRCTGSSAWKVYVTVDVIVTESVLIAAHSLASGHVLTESDVSTVERDVSRLTAGYLSHPKDILGRRLKHQLIEGRILTPGMMKADIVVRRGQSVTLTIRSKSLNISMEGKALMDGSVNQRIKVENTVSRRVVEGIVRSPEHVEVLVF